MDYFSSICVVLMIRVGEWFFWSGRKVEQFKDLLWELNASVIDNLYWSLECDVRS